MYGMEKGEYTNEMTVRIVLNFIDETLKKKKSTTCTSKQKYDKNMIVLSSRFCITLRMVRLYFFYRSKIKYNMSLCIGENMIIISAKPLRSTHACKTWNTEKNILLNKKKKYWKIIFKTIITRICYNFSLIL